MKSRKSVNKLYVIAFLTCSVLFALPSIIYMLKNKTVYEFIGMHTYFFRRPCTQNEKLLNAFIFFTLFSLLFLLYCFILKKHKKIFKSKKQIVILIIIVSILFMIIIPYTSSDVYSYIASGWSASHYKENPYYVSIGQISDNTRINDNMFNKVARCWRYETVLFITIM